MTYHGPLGLRAEAEANAKARADLLSLYPGLSEEDPAFLDTLEGMTDFKEMVEALLSAYLDAEALVAAAKAREADLKERRGRFESKAGALKETLRLAMIEAEEKKLTLAEATLSISKGRAGYEVRNEALLPGQYRRTMTVPDKTKIAEAVKAGEDIPGVVKTIGAPGLSVRRK